MPWGCVFLGEEMGAGTIASGLTVLAATALVRSRNGIAASTRSNPVVDEVHVISTRRGNGKVRAETWVDKAGKVVRYNLTYINHSIFSGDNGRVLRQLLRRGAL